MRDDALAVDCAAREPDPVLLEQLAGLAAASTIPTVKPWWQRFTVKTGAAAVAGALVISGATADAEHARPTNLIATIPEPVTHAAPHHPTPKAPVPSASSPVWSPIGPSIRHAENRARHSELRRAKKNQAGNSNGGGSQNSQGDDQQLSRLAAPVQAVITLDLGGHPRGKAHKPQRSHTQH
jgi:hypothetical protein